MVYYCTADLQYVLSALIRNICLECIYKLGYKPVVTSAQSKEPKYLPYTVQKVTRKTLRLLIM